MEGDIHCSSREEVMGLNTSIRDKETKYNGHKEKIELAKLVETMRSLKMKVKSCREDNEILTRA